MKVSHIRKFYRKKAVLEDVSFTARPGERIAMIGRNGCGKTTLMKILAGIIKPDAGALEYFGQNPFRQRGGFLKLCGYVPQEDPLIEELTVKDNLKLWGQKKCLSDQRLMEMFDLNPILKVQVRKLSGGMKRRVSIACAISQWPPILLMDEPTAAVDLYYKQVLWQWMEQYTALNGILILSTHEEREIRDSQRCLLLEQGQLRELKEEFISPDIFGKAREEQEHYGR